MLSTGQRLVHPALGMEVVLRKTSRDTGGQAVVLEACLEPRGSVVAAHVHPCQQERFEVVTGSVGFRVGGKKLVAGPGQRVLVPPRTSHTLWNAGTEDATLICEITPALRFESLLETLFALAVAGKVGRSGLPSPLRLAVVAHAHFDTFRLPAVPAAAQWAGFAVAAAAGRALGYRPVYLACEALPAPS